MLSTSILENTTTSNLSETYYKPEISSPIETLPENILDLITKHAIVQTHAYTLNGVIVKTVLDIKEAKKLSLVSIIFCRAVKKFITYQARCGRSLYSLGFETKKSAVSFVLKNNINSLNFRTFSSISNRTLNTLFHNIKNFHNLTLTDTEVNDEMIDLFLKNQPPLKTIRLVDCYGLTDKSVEKILNSTPLLKTLSLFDCMELTENAFSNMTKIALKFHTCGWAPPFLMLQSRT